MYPVDVCRALSMASAGSGEKFSVTKYYSQHGLQGFVTKGVMPELVKSTVMRVSKFFFFPIMTETMYGKAPKDCNVIQKGLAGAAATVPEILMIAPLEVAKIGIQLDFENKYKNNSVHFLKDLYNARGISACWSGWAGMQWRQSFWTGTYFATLSSWKKAVEPPLMDVGVPVSIANLISGFLAGFFATFPNAPGDVVRSVVQKKLFLDPTRPAYGISPGGVLEHITVAREIVAVQGLKGLYSGIGFKAIHLGGSGALMAMLIPIFAKMTGIEYAGV
jgi:solute carrier family 25 2-oxodicarboxylate transporter 21